MKQYEVGEIVQTSDGPIMITENSSNTITALQIYEPYKNFDISYTKALDKSYFTSGVHKASYRNYPTPVYRVWKALLKKRNIFFSVCDDWLYFQNFADWYHRQLDRFPGADDMPFTWAINHRLVDPAAWGADPTTSIVAPFPFLQMFRHDGRTKARELPLGVHYFGQRYISFASVFGKGQKHLGVFPTIEAAKNAYWTAKCECVRETTAHYYEFLPKFLADRLMSFNMETAKIYYPNEFER